MAHKYQTSSSSIETFVKPRVGREFQHLEDLVFIEGSAGAERALHVIKNLREASVKWDGNPTIYWGRNALGQFVLVNKNAWGKAECTSPDMLEEFILTSGRGEPWRPAFAESLVRIWPLLEAATPKWTQGYVYGDLLFYPNRPAQIANESVEFTPNKVTYKVNTNTALGAKLDEAKVCIAAHKFYRKFGDADGVFFQHENVYESTSVSVITQTRIKSNIVVEQNKIAKLQNIISESDIDSFLAPIAGLGDLKNIIYTYVNQTSKAGKLDTLGETFFDWLATSKVSHPKQSKIAKLAEEHPYALPTIFNLVKGIMELKNNIIEQFDSVSEIQSYTLNESGGEGYMILDEQIKLVPRHRWVPD